MGEYDFLTVSAKKATGNRVQPPKRGARAIAPEGGASSQDQASGAENGKPARAATVTVATGGELATLSIQRELEREGFDMDKLSTVLKGSEVGGLLTETERRELLERETGRDDAEKKKEAYQERVKALVELIGEAYGRDLIMQPPMWAAQELQPSYPGRQQRAQAQIIAVEIPRLVRVLEAAGLTITKAAPKKPEAEK